MDSKELLSRFRPEEVLNLMYQAGFKEPKKLVVNQKGYATIRCSEHKDEEDKKTGKRASCVVNVNTSSFKCKSCHFEGNLYDVAGKLVRSTNFRDQIEYLANLKGIDLSDRNKSYTPKPIQKPENKEEKIKYFTFDPSHPFVNWSNNQLIDGYFGFSELMKYKAIMTVLIRHSLETNQSKKIDYLCNTRKINPANHRLERVGFLPKKQDDKAFWEWLEKVFPIGDLVRFGVFNAGNEKYKPSWKYYSLDLIVFPNQDIYSDLYHGAQLRPLEKPDWLPGKEIQFTQVSLMHPIPFALSREVLQCNAPITISEGFIDGFSTDADFAANPGVDAYYKPYLGLFRGKRVYVAYDQDGAGQRAMFGYEALSIYSAKRKKTFSRLFAQTKSEKVKALFYKGRILHFAKKTPTSVMHKGLLEALKDAGVKDVFAITWDASLGNDLNELKQKFGTLRKEFFKVEKF